MLLDIDLASIYGVPTKRLNEQVKRNAVRFPEDFRFQLSRDEAAEAMLSRSQTATLKRGKHIKYLPHDILRVIWKELQPFLAPPPDPSKKEVGFHVKQSAACYRAKRKKKQQS